MFQWANPWWPGHAAWCVGTDLDGDSTYVAGSSACIRAIADVRLEALPATIDDRFDACGDEINPAPPGFPPYRRPVWG